MCVCVCGVTYVKTREDLSESPNESRETLHGRGTLKDQTPTSLATAEESSREQFLREPQGVLFKVPKTDQAGCFSGGTNPSV